MNIDIEQLTDNMDHNDSKRKLKSYVQVHSLFLIKYKSRGMLTTGAVWGCMNNFARMSDGVCNAAIETIMYWCGIGSENTVIDAITWLEKHGYIRDLTPNLRNKPHTYLVLRDKVEDEWDDFVTDTKIDAMVEKSLLSK